MSDVMTPYGAVSAELMARAARIRLLVCDVDGVLSNGFIYMGNNGEELKTFCTRDGAGMKAVMRAGIELAIITGRSSRIVADRMKSLGVQHLVQGADEKLPHFERLLAELGLTPDQAAYVGDDTIDLPVMQACGLGIAVADAHPLVLARANMVTRIGGGLGAVREVCDLLLQARGLLGDVVEVSA
ncbi:3-deoxy-manno-octulosonate-8-phosphatase KdsC [Aeromonas diversa]|uniref:3-deoxy-manno-octulosonate-8-phosphatase KdsC n=1 Tax=Aeromonas diversa TaxID=502790 RepID=UPI003461C28B